MRQAVQQKQQAAILQLLAVLLLATLVSHSAAETRICLNMIAKDEADEILDCLQPIVPELAGWTLCDTGSTDGTISLVQEFFANHSMPGNVANHTWKDFGHNRNLCIEAGVEWSLQEAQRQGMAAGSHFCDYLLFLDADQILQRPTEIQPGDLKAMDLDQDSYHMLEKGVGLAYKNLRLVSTRVEWQWVGEVHEFVRRKDNAFNPQHDIDGYWLTHDATGGKGGNRFVRDEIILSKAVQERPRDTRARFYLANTYRALRKVEEAYTHYVVRIGLGGWDEERFMSALNIAEMAKKQWYEGQLISPQVKAIVGNYDTYQTKVDNATLEDEQQRLDAAVANLAAARNASSSSGEDDDAGGGADANDEAVQRATRAVEMIKEARKHREFPVLVAAYLAASAILPYRPEPWGHLARLHRQFKGDHARCYSYAATAIAQGPPRSSTLFLNINIANYEALDELCTCAYYVDDVIEEGRMACHKLEQKLVSDLLLSPGNAYLQIMLDRVKDNLGWYARKRPEETATECAPDAKGQCQMQN